jgi:Flp pilus assembly protein TadG
MSNSRTKRPINAFFRQSSGSVLILFAFALFAILLLGGGTIDYFTITKTRSQLQGIADSAALSGATTAVRQLKSGASAAASQTAGVNAATGFLNGNLATLARSSNTTFNVNPTVDSMNATYVVTATTQVSTYFLGMIGMGKVPVGVTATSSSNSGSQYFDIYLMVDTSGSMMLGASQSDINALITQFNCAFACHDGTAATSVGDAYQWAKANGVTLRYDALFQGVMSLVNYVNAIDSSHTRIRLAVYSFDSTLNRVHPLSADTSSIASQYPQPAVDNSVTGGATLFNENIASVLSDIGTGGTGTSRSSPMKLLIIATDGVEDPGRQWVSDTTLRPNVKGFDMSFCQTAHSSGIVVGIINTPYLPMTWDWGYNATLGMPSSPGPTRLDDIAPSLKNCAGKLYVSATDAAAIRSAFTNIMQNFSAIGLTR